MLITTKSSPVEFHLLRFSEKGELATVEFDCISPHWNIDEAFLVDFEKLANYLEDNPLFTIIFFRGFVNQTVIDLSFSSNIDHYRRWEKVFTQINRLPMITITVINGVCLGFFLQLALVCDFRLGVSESVFIAPEIKKGYLPGMLAFHLAKFVGMGVARQILFTGQPFKAKQALRSGLLDILCASNKVGETISNLVNQLIPVNRVAVQLSRRLLNESFASIYEEAIGQFLAAQHRCLHLNES
jgi:enoyl-CoA hydratase